MPSFVKTLSRRSLTLGRRLESVYNHKMALKAGKRNSLNRDAIFVWVPKTAGSSIYRSLQTIGAQKLITDYAIGRYFLNKGVVTFGHYEINSIVRSGELSDAFLEKAWKFSFVRNPYDRAVSLYEYLRGVDRIPQSVSFKTFCRILENREYEPIGRYNYLGLSQLNPQSAWLMNGDSKPIVDFIGRYENLASDVGQVEIGIGLDKGFLSIGHKNKSKRKGSFREYYTAREIDIVRSVYAEDFAAFNYPLELPRPSICIQLKKQQSG